MTQTDYRLEDTFEHQLETRGCAHIGTATYKAIAWGSTDVPAIECTIAGNREIIVGYNGTFSSRAAANQWARTDARDRGLFDC